MQNLMERVEANIAAMNEMYRIGYEAGLTEGKRRAYAEFAKDLDKITKEPKNG